MENMWSDDPVRSVTANSSCDAYEPDGIVTAGVDDPRCSSCFFCVGSGCHNAVTSGLKMAEYRMQTENRLCVRCAFNEEGCVLATGSVDSSLSAGSQRVVEAYASRPNTSGVCPGFEMKMFASENEDDYPDLDTALFMGGW
jgi:hypothetical protein